MKRAGCSLKRRWPRPLIAVLIPEATLKSILLNHIAGKTQLLPGSTGIIDLPVRVEFIQVPGMESAPFVSLGLLVQYLFSSLLRQLEATFKYLVF